MLRITAMKHLQPGDANDYASELRKLLLLVEQMVDGRALHDVTAFRDTYCYLEGVSNVLEEHQLTLRSLFNEYSKGDGAVGDAMKSAKLMVSLNRL